MISHKICLAMKDIKKKITIEVYPVNKIVVKIRKNYIHVESEANRINLIISSQVLLEQS